MTDGDQGGPEGADPEIGTGTGETGHSGARSERELAASAQAWAARLRAGDRRALARAITRAESGRPDHRLEAEALIDAARPEPGARPAVRIGLSGSPGVGKSSFIEAFGLLLTAAGERVAVLAVDPSSSVSGGSILGDKTRMERLTRDPNAFIRPSPAGAQLGGVARRTRDAIQLVEAAGYSVVLVETVGVGQSEIMVADMTDVFALLIAPAGGDELQGVKRGVMEVADFVLVNKADGALEGPAKATVSDYSSALRLLRRRPGDPEDVPAAAPVSAHTGLGLAEAWDRIKGLHAHRLASGALAARRAGQGLRALRREIQAGLWEAFEADQAAAATLDALSRAVEAGEITPERAARVALAAHRGGEARGGE